MIHETTEDVILILIQGRIFLEGPASVLPSICALSKLLFGARCHIIYVVWSRVLIMDELVTHPSVTLFLGWIQIRP